MLAQRVATAIVGVPVILGLILWGGVAYSVAVAVILTIAALEFFAATDPQSQEPGTRNKEQDASPLAERARPGRPGEGEPRSFFERTLYRLLRQRPPALLGAAAVALLVAGAHNGADWWSGALVLAVALTFVALILRGDVQAGLRDWLWIAGGLLYVGFLGSHLVFLRDLDGDGDWAIVAIFATFATDTAAYFVGRAIGRTHIVPAISPGKTLEGSLAGLAAGVAAVLFLNWVTGLREDALEIIPLALLLPIAAEIGDLAESLIKRGAGVKDAGQLVPGHGGLLDRLDSILFTVPLVYYFVIWVVV
ncbi:MAG: phosphatidate cytidylyltransferase [Chloroflexi bacterium]|nr:phosphatidate cytidylyltransferase [Chloroflexota bacterium]